MNDAGKLVIRSEGNVIAALHVLDESLDTERARLLCTMAITTNRERISEFARLAENIISDILEAENGSRPRLEKLGEYFPGVH